MATTQYFNSGVLIDTSPNGSERVEVDTGYPQRTVMALGSLLGTLGSIQETSGATGNATATVTQVGGPGLVPAAKLYLEMTGSTSGSSALTMPTVALMLAAFPNWVIGQSYDLTVVNDSGNNWVVTGGGGTGWTISTAVGGSATVPTGSKTTFVVTLTSATAITATALPAASGAIGSTGATGPTGGTGTLGSTGTFQLNGTSKVTVTQTVTAASVIPYTIQTVHGTPAVSQITAILGTTGFVVTGTAGDTSVMNYMVLG